MALNFGQAIDVAAGKLTLPDGQTVWSNFTNELSSFTSNAVIGAMSSYLALELGESLGLEGFGAELFSTVSGSVLTNVAANLLDDLPVFSNINAGAPIFDNGSIDWGNAGSAVAYAVVSYFGSKLGSMVVQPESQAASVLATLESAIAAYYGYTYGGLVGAFIGSFLGQIHGTFIGNLFFRKKPRIPTANAEVVLQIPNAEYALGAVAQANGGNIDLVRAMGEAARDTLNGLISVVTYGDENARVSNSFSPSQYYGHTGNQLWVKLGAATAPRTNVNSADEAVDKGVLYALPATQIIGGDMLAKRALYNMVRHPGQVTNIPQLSGGLQIASDYAFYLQNRAVIDAMIAEPYTSMKLATVDYLAYVRGDVARLNAYKAAYPLGSQNADPNAVNLMQIRAWGQTQWEALTPAARIVGGLAKRAVNDNCVSSDARAA